MTTLAIQAATALAARAKDWPTINELAAASGIPGRSIRRAIADGDLAAFRLNVLRVDPDTFAGWLVSRQK